MYKTRVKSFEPGRSMPGVDVVNEPVTMRLGSQISEQMYHGVNTSQSTLLSGEYDDEDNFDVDPACDFNTDRFGYKESLPGDLVNAPKSDPAPSE